jgi:hypothetical protein
MLPDVRKGMPPARLSRAEFERRYRARFADPAFTPRKFEDPSRGLADPNPK